MSICVFSEIVHEDVKMSSDGESDPPSSDGVQSPVRVRLRNKKISSEVHTDTIEPLYLKLQNSQ